MDNRTKTAIGVGAIVATIGTAVGLLWYAAKSSGQNAYSLTLSPTSVTETVNQPFTLTATFTQAGKPVANATVTLLDVTNPNNPITLTSATTNSSGIASLSYTYTTAGNYVVQAEAST